MTASEAKAEFQRLAQSHGLTPEVTTAVLQAMDNPKFAEDVAAGYTRHSEYSSALDKARNLQAQNEAIQTWWNQQGGKQLFETAQTQLPLLAKYRELYGDLTDGNGGNGNGGNGNGARPYVSREDFEKALKDQESRILASVSGSMVTYDKQLNGIRLGHLQRHKEILDETAFENFMSQQRIDPRNPNAIRDAYAQFVKPKEEALQKLEREEHDKQIAEKAVQDYLTRTRQPGFRAENQPISVMEDYLAESRRKDVDHDTEAKNEFLSAWRDAASSTGTEPVKAA